MSSPRAWPPTPCSAGWGRRSRPLRVLVAPDRPLRMSVVVDGTVSIRSGGSRRPVTPPGHHTPPATPTNGPLVRWSGRTGRSSGTGDRRRRCGAPDRPTYRRSLMSITCSPSVTPRPVPRSGSRSQGSRHGSPTSRPSPGQRPHLRGGVRGGGAAARPRPPVVDRDPPLLGVLLAGLPRRPAAVRGASSTSPGAAATTARARTGA